MTYPNDSGWADPRLQQPPYAGPPQGYPPQQYAPHSYAGQPYPGAPYGWAGYGYGPAPKNGPGTAALALGIVALCTFWVPLLYLVASVPCGVIAIVQGSKGRRFATAGWATNGGKAKAGVICGVMALVLCALNFGVGVWLGSQLTP